MLVILTGSLHRIGRGWAKLRFQILKGEDMSNSAFDEVREELIKKNETEAFKAGLIDNIEITWLNSVMIFTLSDRLRAGTYVVPDADLAVIDLRSLFSLLNCCPDDTRYLK